MNLYIAKESCFIYADEFYMQRMSQMLDDKSKSLKREQQKGDGTQEDLSIVKDNKETVYRMTYMNLNKEITSPIAVKMFLGVVALSLINVPRY